MSENKYGKVLTIILVIVIIAIIALLGFFGYDVYKKATSNREVAQVINEFEESIINTVETENTIEGEVVIPIINEEIVEQTTTTSTGTAKKVTYKGYNVIGTIEIPKINLKYPILERVTKDSVEQSVSMLYGPGPNIVGNTVIIGHNYRNGAFFGNNDRLSLGDIIYITDTSGNRVKYIIYNIYETTPDDADYMTRDTNSKREISLSTCTDNSKARLIIWAAEE